MLGPRCTPELRHHRGGLILPASIVRMMTSGDPHGGSSDPSRIGSHEALKAFMKSAGVLDHRDRVGTSPEVGVAVEAEVEGGGGTGA